MPKSSCSWTWHWSPRKQRRSKTTPQCPSLSVAVQWLACLPICLHRPRDESQICSFVLLMDVYSRWVLYVFHPLSGSLCYLKVPPSTVCQGSTIYLTRETVNSDLNIDSSPALADASLDDLFRILQLQCVPHGFCRGACPPFTSLLPAVLSLDKQCPARLKEQ